MMEQSKFIDRNIAFETIACFDDSHAFERCCFNELSFNYYIGFETFQNNNINNKNNETNTSFRINGSKFNQANKARLIIINLLSVNAENFFAIIQNDIVMDIIIIQHLRYFLKLMRTFYMYFNVDSIQSSIFNNPFDKFNIMHTIFTNDNTNSNGIRNSIGIKLFNNIFNNRSRPTIMWTLTNFGSNDSFYFEYNKFDGNNDN